MKKRICIFIALVMVSVFSSIAYAEESYDAEKRVHYIIDSNGDQYGGYYRKGDEIHIVPYSYAKKAYVSNNEIKEISRKTGIKVVYDKDARYSAKELENAYGKLVEKWSELELKEMSVDIKDNSIIVVSDIWSEEKKRTAKEYSGIENILFKTDAAEKENAVPKAEEVKITEAENPYSAIIAFAWAVKIWF